MFELVMAHKTAVTPREAASDLAHDEAAEIAARLHQTEAALLELAVRVMDGELWAGGGILSPEHWLVLRVGLSPARAHDVTRVAHRWASMPTLASAVRAGSVSLDQAAVVAKFVPPDHERAATELAERATVPQLRRALSRYQFTEGNPPLPVGAAAEAGSAKAGSAAPTGVSEETGAPERSSSSAAAPGVPAIAEPVPGALTPVRKIVIPALRDPEGAGTAGSLAWALQPPELTMGHANGRFWVRFSAPSDVGALVEQALLEAKDALFRAATAGDDGVGRDARVGSLHGSSTTGGDGPRITMGEAMVEVANRSLSTVTSASRAQRYRVYVHLSGDGSWINGRGAIPPSLAAKFACDGVVQPIWEIDGVPVNVGRDQRIVPDRSRRLIEDRDRGCRYPGCSATRHVEVHHLDHWADGGATDVDRMLSLCPRHHDAHHRGEFSMVGSPSRLDGVVFRNDRGRDIRVGGSPTPPPATPTDDHRGELDVLTPYRGPTGEQLITKWVTLSSNTELATQDAWRRKVAEPAGPRASAEAATR